MRRAAAKAVPLLPIPTACPATIDWSNPPMDCLFKDVLLTIDDLEYLMKPPCQRFVSKTKRVERLTEEMLKTGRLGVGILLVMGLPNGEVHLVDGNHRIEAFRNSGLKSIIVSVQTKSAKTYKDIAEEYIRCQCSLKTSTVDDKLKGIAVGHPPLQKIAQFCTFVTYKRASTRSDCLISMSDVVHCWFDASTNPPTRYSGDKGIPIEECAKLITDKDAACIIEWLLVCQISLGTVNRVLWAPLNMTLCLWLYKQMVKGGCKGPCTRLKIAEFGRGLAGLVNMKYTNYLKGLKLTTPNAGGNAFALLREHFRGGLASAGIRASAQIPVPKGWPKKPEGVV